VQLAAPHESDEPGYAHALTFEPSQSAAHGPLPGQAARAGEAFACGAPVTGTQVPSEPATSHA
jgi:hypothetical protein